jgi:hypothetical protein
MKCNFQIQDMYNITYPSGLRYEVPWPRNQTLSVYLEKICIRNI